MEIKHWLNGQIIPKNIYFKITVRVQQDPSHNLAQIKVIRGIRNPIPKNLAFEEIFQNKTQPFYHNKNKILGKINRKINPKPYTPILKKYLKNSQTR